MEAKIATTRATLKRPLTLTEKYLFAHAEKTENYIRGRDYVNFYPDRVAMQDATAQMALLQFMTANRMSVAVPTTVHCDHLIQANVGAGKDLTVALEANKEVYNFLSQVSQKYGIGFYKPGAGIIHQVVLENYAFPGGFMIGTDSHTPNAGGLGMIAVGVGGNDAAEVMAGLPWELRMPKVIGVELTGAMNGWTTPKDIILKLAKILTVKGGTGAIIEYFGEGAKTISCTGKGTICNMGAEIGSTCSIFPYDEKMASYLCKTGREEIAILASDNTHNLRADDEVYANPQKYYDQVITIDLSTLAPHVNGPYSPDTSSTVNELGENAKEKGWPLTIEAALIGSCTNSSYEDIALASSVAEFALANNLKLQCPLIITPGSETVLQAVTRDGLLEPLIQLGATVMANACGPCIGQWARHTTDKEKKNTIISSFNRNFAKRNDGLSGTHAFVASPSIVMAYALSGTLDFNPLTDKLHGETGEEILLVVPTGSELPETDFVFDESGYQAPAENGEGIEIIVDENSERIQLLEPFLAYDGSELESLPLLLKAKGKCTTDHISMAGSWLKYRGHLDNISNNMLIGAINAFNGQANSVQNLLTEQYGPVPATQRYYQSQEYQTVVVAEDNYGEGSSREHAAMEPRYLGVIAIIAKSFARIHETNLKKQGMLALTFADPADYDKIQEEDFMDIDGVKEFAPGVPLTVVLHHGDKTTEEIVVNHTYNAQQIEWFKAGSALNYMNLVNT